MQAISENPITQGKHGLYNAVDISPSPDIYYYAPEDGTITAWGDSGTCGLRLELTGASGRHGFCHNELTLVSVGAKVKRGQKLAKMGYTGYTIPSGVRGRHVHWVIQQNGVYVYPPSLVNQSFIKEGADMSTFGSFETDALCKGFFGYPASAGDYAGSNGKESNERIRWFFANPAYLAREKLVTDLIAENKALKQQIADGSGGSFVETKVYVKKG